VVWHHPWALHARLQARRAAHTLTASATPLPHIFCAPQKVAKSSGGGSKGVEW
jgi:hypothetical protein